MEMKNQFVRNNVRSVVARGWITSWRNSVSVVIGTYIALTLVGCGSIGMMASKTETFTGKDSITLKTPRPDILSIVAEVGKSLGYSVSSLDKEAGTISLSYDAGLFTGVMIGKINKITLTIFERGGNKLGISVFLMGNFGSGSQEAAGKLVEDFKVKLLEKIGE